MKNDAFRQPVQANPCLGVLAESRSVLMLQGPVGPFFDRLTVWLKAQGVPEVNRVVFSGGDQWDCQQVPHLVFKGDLADWPAFLQNLLRNYHVDCLVLFGQGRPHHCKAMVLASLLVRKAVFQEVGGLDEANLKVSFNDVDFCLKVREAGYRNLFTPYAELYHHESISRGPNDTRAKRAVADAEARFMRQKWGKLLDNDPYYNPNLTLVFEDFSLR